MTNEEMARVLERGAENARIWAECYQGARDEESIATARAWMDVAIASDAGAAALRREQWKPIEDAPEECRFGFLAGHVGSERIDHCFHRDTAIRQMHTHYRDLPDPPEGV